MEFILIHRTIHLKHANNARGPINLTILYIVHHIIVSEIVIR